MKAFIVSMVALIVITVGANLLLTQSDIYPRQDVSRDSVRLGN
ncbi:MULTISPECIES: hypothetical protein [unclassified Sulfitobacter]|jgi:hypothetical protein|nr:MULTISPECIES: hypothetical protein [unclassified Sulfitobacter]